VIDLDSTDLSTLEAVLDTDKGEMVFGFYAEQAPAHVRNFLDLAQRGFYDGLAFHRVVRSFMVQGGCPNTREGARGVPGTGGPGYQIPAEFNDVEHRRGVMSMARSQHPDSAGSQFFVVHAEHARHLDRQYTAFAHMKSGFDVLDEIASVEVEFGAAGERSKPVERVGLRSVRVRVAPESDAAPQEAGEAGS
jgi:peptidyl-prolyl cis-trans isomerase B (cyclophilin B)